MKADTLLSWLPVNDEFERKISNIKSKAVFHETNNACYLSTYALPPAVFSPTPLHM